MKKILLSLITIGFAGLLVSAVAQDAPGGNPGDTNAPAVPQPATPPGQDNGPDNGGPPPPTVGGDQPGLPGQPPADNGPDEVMPDNGTNAGPLVIQPATGKTAPREEIAATFMPPDMVIGTNQNDLNLNFRNAPLEMVLNYLSDAAGFIIVQEVRVNGSVTIKGSHLTKDEVVDLLNAELNKNNYAALRKGRTLTILDKTDAKTSRIPVRSGNKPDDIPDNAEIVTQIIPIRFVEARSLVSDLTSFVSSQATVVANEAANSVVITDTQANIRHLMEIIKAIDDSAEAETEIQVFKLQHANPTDVASELSSVFPSSTSGNTAQAPTRFGGGGGGPGGFFARMMGGGGGGSSSGGSNDRIKKATQVTAVADLRIQAVIVTAPKDLMTEIAGMMDKLDVVSDRDQDVTVLPLVNGDPQQVVQVLQTMFQSSGSTRSGGSSSSQNSLLMQRSQNQNTSMGTTTTTSGIGSSGVGGGGGRGGTIP
jgi:type II secretory pathway component GspD/PulD (secretin)